MKHCQTMIFGMQDHKTVHSMEPVEGKADSCITVVMLAWFQ